MLRKTLFEIVYSSGEKEPIEFFYKALITSVRFDLGLGYFSSTAINVLSAGFANFIYRGGKMRVVINNQLPERDKKAIEAGITMSDIDFEESIIEDLDKFTETLSKQDEHFFNCLSYLISKERVEFIATIPANNKGGVAHSKYGIFTDESNNKVVFNGSANFSKNALLNNIESISCYKSWTDSVSEKERLRYFENLFNKIWSGESKNIKIIPINKVKGYIQDNFPVMSIEQLFDAETALIEESDDYPDIVKEKHYDFYSKLNRGPKFPFATGPREYQKEAYVNWEKNNYHGIFAMATGTGKTITSLNCILNEYKKTGKYNVLILVPTLALVSQWKEEVRKFNFKSYVLVSGETKWQEDLSNYKANYIWRKKEDNIVIISTYPSFTNPKFLNLFKAFQKNFTIIADEAHNIGAPTIKDAFQQLTCEKRIALSATPKRIYDLEGTKELEELFKDKEPYCYSYSLEKAIKNNFLTPYLYYPKIVRLKDYEMDEYIELSRRLFIYFDSNTGSFKKSVEVEKLLLQRKRIIHKAINKLSIFSSVIKELKEKDKLHYCLVFAPEGDYIGDHTFEDFNNIIQRFVLEANNVCPYIRQNSYTSKDSRSDREDKLRGFEEGKIDMLFTMKAIDEGVDIPRAEIGIFASSTGNPRQFIQRRGRLLRKHPDKQFATIYDMIVIPDSEGVRYFNMERNLVKTELIRVAYFASLSENFYDSKSKLEDIMLKYNLNLDTIIKEL